MVRRFSESDLERRRASRPPITYPEDLPIALRRDDLLRTIADHQVVIVSGETGSGKSTQLPKLCLELGRGVNGLIGHTQPRRVAARTIAQRVSDELARPLGSTVGYSVRFTDRIGDDTLVRVMTDGILLAEIQRDRQLQRYDTIIIDEAHERSLNIDFLLGYLTHLLPQRPDLKLIVTSATLDTDRFARHFSNAPVVEVSGRSYPVEIRYRPFGEEPGDDRDQVSAIIDAVEELGREGQGDVLVFLSGEREIHDAADAIRRAELPHTEVLPLYARLSAAEQQRVFEPHTGRRVILSTNVAETSLTVPGVRYVVDTGTARISRYNRRLKVQRLPIEPVSQASANQRAGRCGRVAPGICIRLYGEDDFAQRPEFTEPEILRTNLASVILQMSAIGLGDIASFPFVQPPDQRSITDGIGLLDELGAFVPTDTRSPGTTRRLTKLGRRLAQLPIDPRLGRMVLEAERLGCAREVLVIAAALSIQDPRERPAEFLEQANAKHRRFDAEDASDFMALVRLWDYLRGRQRELSGNQFRRLCREDYLHYLRVREWQDLYSQLRRVASDLGIHLNGTAAHPDHVHQALLSGLLSHIGMREGESKEFRGARSAKFQIGRGSAQAKRPAKWVMAGELVETDRLRARVVARIQPEWAEKLGAHLAKYNYGEPEWDAAAGQATIIERVTLFGLPIVAGRRVQLSRIDAALARAMFIRHALVLEEWESDHRFVHHNRELLDEVRALGERLRRLDIVPDDEDLERFYAERLPADITSTRHFDKWWRDARRTNPKLLELTRDTLLHQHVDELDSFPEQWTAFDPPLPVEYGFDPGGADDGVTIHIPLLILNQVEAAPFTWLVPGLREELVGAYLKALPKDKRRLLVPAADHIRRATDAVMPGPTTDRMVDFATTLASCFAEQCGERISARDFDLSTLPRHLQVTFAIDDADGKVVARGKDLDALAVELRPAVRREIARVAGDVERTDLVDWTFGVLPSVVEARLDGFVARGFPALVDDGAKVQLRILTTAAAARRATRRGVRRLLLLTLPLPRKACARLLTNDARLALGALGWPSAVDLVDDAVGVAIDALLSTESALPVDEAGFRSLQQRVAGDLVPTAESFMRAGIAAVVTGRGVDERIRALRAPQVASAAADLAAQLQRLVHPGCLTEAGPAHAGHLHRYLEAMDHRLTKLRERPERDRQIQGRIASIEERFAAVLADPAGAKMRWSLEELRVSLFAQHLGTAESVSEPRLVAELSRVAEGTVRHRV